MRKFHRSFVEWLRILPTNFELKSFGKPEQLFVLAFCRRSDQSNSCCKRVWFHTYLDFQISANYRFSSPRLSGWDVTLKLTPNHFAKRMNNLSGIWIFMYLTSKTVRYERCSEPATTPCENQSAAYYRNEKHILRDIKRTLYNELDHKLETSN